MHEDSFETFSVVNTNNMKGEIYVIANNGEDKESLWKYDIENKNLHQKYMDQMKVIYSELYIITTSQNIRVN